MSGLEDNNIVIIIKSILKYILPPLAFYFWRFLRQRNRYESFTGDYKDWEAALAACDGYDSELIFKKVVAATRDVVSGVAAYERDGVTFDEIQYSWPLSTAVALYSKTDGDGVIRVIDYGGSLGTTYRQNRKLFDKFKVEWRIVEQEHFVSLGRQEFSDEELSFYITFREANFDKKARVVLFCGSICYLPNPKEILRDVLHSEVEYIVFDRTPFVSEDRDRLSIQQVPPEIYQASYPIRLFSLDNFARDYLPGWRAIWRWKCDLQPDRGSVSYGYVFSRE